MNEGIIVFLAFCAGMVIGGVVLFRTGYQIGVIDASKVKGGK